MQQKKGRGIFWTGFSVEDGESVYLYSAIKRRNPHGILLIFGIVRVTARCPKRDRSRTSSGYPSHRSRLVRHAHIGKCCKQVFMGPDHVLRYFSICEERKEEIYDIVGERPAIVRVGRRPRGIVVEHVRQQVSCDPL